MCRRRIGILRDSQGRLMVVRGLLPLVLLAVPPMLRGAGSPPLRQVRWWSSHIDETVDMVYAHRRSVTGIYPCCGGPSTAANGSFEWDGTCERGTGRATGTSSWVEAMAPLVHRLPKAMAATT